MPLCPMCNKPLRELARRCPSCQADLDLLVDYVSHLSGGLQRAENLTRAGELGQAVWAYLEVLDVDPDNAAARAQVSQVVSAVRNFDQSSPTRRMLDGVNGQPGGGKARAFWTAPRLLLLGMALVLAFSVGFLVGGLASGTGGDGPRPPKHDDKTLGG